MVNFVAYLIDDFSSVESYQNPYPSTSFLLIPSTWGQWEHCGQEGVWVGMYK